MEKELKELAEQLNVKMADFEKINKAIQEELKGKVDAASLDKLKEAADKAGADVVKLNEEFEKFQFRMKDNAVRPMSFEDAFKAAFKPEDLKGMDIRKGSINKGFKLDVDPYSVFKADMTAGTNLTYGTFASSVVEPVRIGGVAKAPDRQVALLDLLPIGQLAPNQPRLTWVERSARTAGAAARNEGAKMGNSDFTYIQKSTDVQNISTYVKTTRESLEYWDQLLSEIRIELMPMLQRKLDDYLISGNGTPPQLLGLCDATVAHAYTYTGLNASVVAPTIGDAVFSALTQVRVNEYRPNFILMHPTDVAKMMLTKDANANSAKSVVYDMSGNPIVGGIIVKENTGITAGNVLIGDSSKASVWFRKGIDIRIWDQNEDDPIYNNVTITADMAAAFKIPTVYYNAFVYDSIADIQAAIAKV